MLKQVQHDLKQIVSFRTCFGISIMKEYNMKNINLILSSITALLGLLVGIAPYTFAKVCGMASMHCHKVTAPTVLVFGILIFVISAIQTVILWKKR